MVTLLVPAKTSHSLGRFAFGPLRELGCAHEDSETLGVRWIDYYSIKYRVYEDWGALK